MVRFSCPSFIVEKELLLNTLWMSHGSVAEKDLEVGHSALIAKNKERPVMLCYKNMKTGIFQIY